MSRRISPAASIFRKSRNKVINIGADQPWSVNAMAELTLKAFGSNLPVHHLPARNEAYQVWATHERARKLLGAVPAVGLDEGIRRMADWARAKGIRKTRIFSEIEVSRNLPPSWAALHESEFQQPELPAEIPGLRK